MGKYKYIKHHYNDSMYGKVGDVVDKNPFNTKSDDPYINSEGGGGWLWKMDGQFGSTFLINPEDVEEIK